MTIMRQERPEEEDPALYSMDSFENEETGRRAPHAHGKAVDLNAIFREGFSKGFLISVQERLNGGMFCHNLGGDPRSMHRNFYSERAQCFGLQSDLERMSLFQSRKTPLFSDLPKNLRSVRHGKG